MSHRFHVVWNKQPAFEFPFDTRETVLSLRQHVCDHFQLLDTAKLLGLALGKRSESSTTLSSLVLKSPVQKLQATGSKRDVVVQYARSEVEQIKRAESSKEQDAINESYARLQTRAQERIEQKKQAISHDASRLHAGVMKRYKPEHIAGYFAEQAVHGDTRELDTLVNRHHCQIDARVMTSCIELGCFENYLFLEKLSRPWPQLAYLAAKEARMDFLEHFYRQAPDSVTYSFENSEYAVIGGHLHVLKWLMEKNAKISLRVLLAGIEALIAPRLPHNPNAKTRAVIPWDRSAPSTQTAVVAPTEAEPAVVAAATPVVTMETATVTLAKTESTAVTAQPATTDASAPISTSEAAPSIDGRDTKAEVTSADPAPMVSSAVRHDPLDVSPALVAIPTPTVAHVPAAAAAAPAAAAPASGITFSFDQKTLQLHATRGDTKGGEHTVMTGQIAANVQHGQHNDDDDQAGEAVSSAEQQEQREAARHARWRASAQIARFDMDHMIRQHHEREARVQRQKRYEDEMSRYEIAMKQWTEEFACRTAIVHYLATLPSTIPPRESTTEENGQPTTPETFGQVEARQTRALPLGVWIDRVSVPVEVKNTASIPYVLEYERGPYHGLALEHVARDNLEYLCLHAAKKSVESIVLHYWTRLRHMSVHAHQLMLEFACRNRLWNIVTLYVNECPQLISLEHLIIACEGDRYADVEHDDRDRAIEIVELFLNRLPLYQWVRVAPTSTVSDNADLERYQRIRSSIERVCVDGPNSVLVQAFEQRTTRESAATYLMRTLAELTTTSARNGHEEVHLFSNVICTIIAEYYVGSTGVHHARHQSQRALWVQCGLWQDNTVAQNAKKPCLRTERKRTRDGGFWCTAEIDYHVAFPDFYREKYNVITHQQSNLLSRSALILSAIQKTWHTMSDDAKGSYLRSDDDGRPKLLYKAGDAIHVLSTIDPVWWSAKLHERLGYVYAAAMTRNSSSGSVPATATAATSSITACSTAASTVALAVQVHMCRALACQLRGTSIPVPATFRPICDVCKVPLVLDGRLSLENSFQHCVQCPEYNVHRACFNQATDPHSSHTLTLITDPTDLV